MGGAMPTIFLSAGTQRIPVPEVSGIIADALYPTAQSSAEPVLVELNKAVGARIYALDEAELKELEKIWQALPPLKMGISQSKWEAYQLFFNFAAEKPDIVLAPRFDKSPTLTGWHQALFSYEIALKDNMRAGKTVPTTADGLPVQNATDEQLKQCYISVKQLKEFLPYGISVGIIPDERSTNNPSSNDGVQLIFHAMNTGLFRFDELQQWGLRNHPSINFKYHFPDIEEEHSANAYIEANILPHFMANKYVSENFDLEAAQEKLHRTGFYYVGCSSKKENALSDLQASIAAKYNGLFEEAISNGELSIYDPLTYFKIKFEEEKKFSQQISCASSEKLLDQSEQCFQSKILTKTTDNSKYPWVPDAQEIAKDLLQKNPRYKNLSVEQLAEKVEVEMTSKGIKKARGGKVPKAGSIKRHALKGIKS